MNKLAHRNSSELEIVAYTIAINPLWIVRTVRLDGKIEWAIRRPGNTNICMNKQGLWEGERYPTLEHERRDKASPSAREHFLNNCRWPTPDAAARFLAPIPIPEESE